MCSFVNEAPLLLVNAASMRRLLSSMGRAEVSPVTTRDDTLPPAPQVGGEADTQNLLNFRPNLVLEGASPHEEEQWTSLVCRHFSSFLPVVLDVDKPCARCSIVNINTQSGVMNKSVLSHLNDFSKKGSGAVPSFGLFVKVRAEAGAGAGEEQATSPLLVVEGSLVE